MRSLYLGLCLVIAAVSGCSTGEAQRANGNAAVTPQGSPMPLSLPTKTFTEADLAKLKWIVGSWRGTGGGVEPFYERYSFRNPRTLAVESFTDESLQKLTGTSLYTLQDGHFGSSHYSMSDITDDAATFVPIISTAKNSFVWKRESESVWKATLTWPATDGKPAGERIYVMAKIEEQK